MVNSAQDQRYIFNKYVLKAALEAAKAERDAFFKNTLSKEGDDVGKVGVLIKEKKIERGAEMQRFSELLEVHERELVRIDSELSDLYDKREQEIKDVSEQKAKESEINGAIKAIENLING